MICWTTQKHCFKFLWPLSTIVSINFKNSVLALLILGMINYSLIKQIPLCSKVPFCWTTYRQGDFVGKTSKTLNPTCHICS